MTGIGAVRSGGGSGARIYGSSRGVAIRVIEGDRWRANAAADLLLELYRDLGLRWLALTIYTDDDRAHTLPASPDEPPDECRPAFVTDSH